MKRAIEIFFLIFFLINSTYSYAKGLRYKDKDWNVYFYDNCVFPSYKKENRNLRWIKEKNNKFLRFQLSNKQIGKCSSDNKIRNGAPYWERAELKQVSIFKKNTSYEIKFKVRFIKGFQNDYEYFFQIHGYSSKECNSPILFIQTKGRNKHLRVLLRKYPSERDNNISNLIKKGSFKKYKLATNSSRRIFIKDILNKWTNIKLLIHFKKTDGILDMYFDEEKVLEKQSFDILKCHTPHIKFGIYRPGNSSNKNFTSIIDFDKFIINEISRK